MIDIATSVIVWPSALLNVPAPDPLGLPVPAWILQALSYLTLALHFTAVHFTVGGALLLLCDSAADPAMRRSPTLSVPVFRSECPTSLRWVFRRFCSCKYFMASCFTLRRFSWEHSGFR